MTSPLSVAEAMGPPAIPLPPLASPPITEEPEIADDESMSTSSALPTPRADSSVVKLVYSPKPPLDAAKSNSPNRGLADLTEGLAGLSAAAVEVMSSSGTESLSASSTDEEGWSDEEESAEDGDEEEGDAFEEEYEVDVGPLKEKIAAGGGGTVEMRTSGDGDEWGSRLLGLDGRSAATVPLEPFNHQVGGHSHIFRFSKKAVCKVSSRVRDYVILC